MQILKIQLELPIPVEGGTFAELLGMPGSGRVVMGTEVMVDNEEEAQEQGESFSHMVEAFMKGLDFSKREENDD
jgi:hypothetical protein